MRRQFSSVSPESNVAAVHPWEMMQRFLHEPVRDSVMVLIKSLVIDSIGHFEYVTMNDIIFSYAYYVLLNIHHSIWLNGTCITTEIICWYWVYDLHGLCTFDVVPLRLSPVESNEVIDSETQLSYATERKSRRHNFMVIKAVTWLEKNSIYISKYFSDTNISIIELI